jgi:acetylornithine/succinyldiaminopimelate/putrescine aminotransferase
MGALSVTHDEHYRGPFMPLLGPVTFVPDTRPDLLASAVNDQTAAVIAEPIRGEGGIRPLPAEFAQAISEVCVRTGTLLIADEVQSGLGRTGYPFHSQALGWKPDLMSVGKALGSGVPIGAALVAEHVAQTISPGDHGSTYGGNLLATRAAAFVLEQLMDHGLIEHVKTVGDHFERRLRTLAMKHPLIVEVRGAGVMRGLELQIDAAPVIEQARQRGLLVNRTDEKVVRLLPPLTIEAAEIDRAVDMLDEVFAAMPPEVPA